MPRISITRSYGAFIFRFLRILHTDFHLFQLFESSLYWFPEWLNQFAVTATVCKSYFSPYSFQHLLSFVWGHSSWSKIKSQICFNMCFLTAKDDEYFWVYFLAIFFLHLWTPWSSPRPILNWLFLFVWLIDFCFMILCSLSSLYI